MDKDKNGFTLIELLITIAIIGILAMAVTIAFSSSIKKSKIAKTKTEMRQVGNVVQSMGISNGKLLSAVTGNWSSFSGACMGGKDYRNVPDTDPCVTAWVNDLNKIADASGVPRASLNYLQRDAWGSPYALDENEMESWPEPGHTDLAYLCTRHDALLSFGPDGIMLNPDDIVYGIPFTRCPEGLHDNCPGQPPTPLGFTAGDGDISTGCH